MKISSKCCKELKKKIFLKYERDNGRTLAMTGQRAGEGGTRKYNFEHKGCVLRDKNGDVYRFNPLAPFGYRKMKPYSDPFKTD